MRRMAEPSVLARNSSSLHANSSTSSAYVAARAAAGNRASSRELGELVPRADQLAVVAAEDAVAHQGAQFLGNRALQLDGQVGDAAACVELIRRRRMRLGRADIDAGAAACRSVRWRAARRPAAADRCKSRRERTTSRPCVLISIVFLPIQPSPAFSRQRLFQHRRAVDEGAVAERGRSPPGCARPVAAGACASACGSRGPVRSAKCRPCCGSASTSRRIACRRGR